MTKKIRLIDEEATTDEATSAGGASFTPEQIQQLMKFAEQIDWKLWELLKLARADAEK
jgi:archaellum component FlaC